MMEAIEANWMIWGAAVLLVLLIGWLLLGRARKSPTKREYKPDVLDQGASSVQRNQALIDAAPAAQVVPPAFGGAMAGVAEAVAVGAQDVVEEAATQPTPAEIPTPPAVAPEAEPATPAPEVEPAPSAPETTPASPPEVSPPTEAATTPEPAPEPAPPQPEGEPVPTQTPTPEPPPAQPDNPGGSLAGDDLSKIKGLGPKLQALLPSLGLSTYAQIAALTPNDLAELDGKLGAFAGRPAKDNWVEQAKYLAAGDVAGFEAQFGKV